MQFSPLSFTPLNKIKYCYYLHFADEKTEAQSIKQFAQCDIDDKHWKLGLNLHMEA